MIFIFMKFFNGKRNKILYFINWILVFSIPTILATTTIKTDEIAANVDVKNLKTNLD